MAIDGMTENNLKHSILLVDDESDILFSLKGLLRKEFELYTAESGQEALKILQQYPIHVVMTDQRMPEMSGVELISRVKTNYPDAICIVFTGYADIKAIIDAINKGGLYRYITKPWDPDELIEVLREATREYDSHLMRRQLIVDLRNHIEAIQSIAKPLLDTTESHDRAAVKEFIQSGNDLLRRIAQSVE